MKGGLGNQMFQYALYSSFKKLGREVKMDDVTGFRNDYQRDPALSVFGIDYERADKAEVVRLTDSYMDPFSRIRRKLTGRRTLEYDEKDGNYDSEVLKLTDAYLVGFWQSERYFDAPGLQSLLRQEFLAKRDIVMQNYSELYSRIVNCESVSIHIRRGDYLQPGTVETFGNICTPEYYEKAVEMIRSRYPGAVFYIFSNDIEWVRKNFTKDGFIPVTASDEDTQQNDSSDIAQLYLMAACRHHILANSSFSWWGAWLGRAVPDAECSMSTDISDAECNRSTAVPGAECSMKKDAQSDSDGEASFKDSMVIAPAKWLNNKQMTDIYTSEMIRI